MLSASPVHPGSHCQPPRHCTVRSSTSRSYESCAALLHRHHVRPSRGCPHRGAFARAPRAVHDVADHLHAPHTPGPPLRLQRAGARHQRRDHDAAPQEAPPGEPPRRDAVFAPRFLPSAPCLLARISWCARGSERCPPGRPLAADVGIAGLALPSTRCRAYRGPRDQSSELRYTLAPCTSRTGQQLPGSAPAVVMQWAHHAYMPLPPLAGLHQQLQRRDGQVPDGGGQGRCLHDDLSGGGAAGEVPRFATRPGTGCGIAPLSLAALTGMHLVPSCFRSSSTAAATSTTPSSGPTSRPPATTRSRRGRWPR